MRLIRYVALLLPLLGACGDAEDGARAAAETAERTAREATDRAKAVFAASPIWRGEREPTPEELERGRLDPSWRRTVQLDSAPQESPRSNAERWEQISPGRVNRGTMSLPLSGDVSGPSVLRAQVLLDRAHFSPGIIDGRWGKNTEKAVYWLQRREGLRATGQVDSATFARLKELAGSPPELVTQHRLTAEDVEGPFVEIPDSIYEAAKLECMCYESLTEKLSEKFHVTPELLRQLNPGVDLDGLRAGSTLQAPAVTGPDEGASAQAQKIVVSGDGFYLHALDGNGRILYHFPSTLGSEYDPSPQGDYRVTSVTEDPWWHYQPSILEHVPDDRPEARIPPGPNNAVGVVWIDLSAPHYGIHGTRAPETIGYTTSAGCVRLTNWDALFLARRVQKGIPVQFSDTRTAGGAADTSRATRAR